MLELLNLFTQAVAKTEGRATIIFFRTEEGNKNILVSINRRVFVFHPGLETSVDEEMYKKCTGYLKEIIEGKESAAEIQ